MALKRVKLQATGRPAPTGQVVFRRPVSDRFNDQTRPAHGYEASGRSDTAGSRQGTGVWRNPPKPRPHILKGWEYGS